MKCPVCAENQEESMCFPANNLKKTEKPTGFLDEHGVWVEPKSVALEYGCTLGHVFKLEDIKKAIGEENLPRMSGPIPVS